MKKLTIGFIGLALSCSLAWGNNYSCDNDGVNYSISFSENNEEITLEGLSKSACEIGQVNYANQASFLGLKCTSGAQFIIVIGELGVGQSFTLVPQSQITVTEGFTCTLED